MLITYFLIILLGLLLGYFIGLPVSKKRPVFIRERGGALIATLLISLLATFNPWVYLVAAFAGLVLLYAFKPWIIYGISGEQINSAIERAALATRTAYLKQKTGYKLDNESGVRILKLEKKLHLIQFKIQRGSKKTLLTKNVGRKFIQNYFIET